MALGGLHLCKKCSFFLGVRKLCSDLQQSARFLHSANARFSCIPQSTFTPSFTRGPAWPVGITGRFHKPPQTETWKLTVCQYSDTTVATLASRESRRLPADPAQTGIISKQPGHPEGSLFGTLPLPDSQAPLPGKCAAFGASSCMTKRRYFALRLINFIEWEITVHVTVTT